MAPKLQLLIDSHQRLHIRLLNHKSILIKLHRHISLYRCQEFREPNLLHIRLNLSPQRPFNLIRMLQHIINPPKLLQQLHRSLLTHTRTTRNIIRRITHQPQQINHLRSRLQPPFLQNFSHTKRIKSRTTKSRFINLYMLSHQLPIILIRCHHQHLETLFFSQPSQRTNHIISLIARHLNHRYSIRLHYLLNNRHRLTNILRRSLPISLILLVRLMPKRRSRRVKHHSQMRRLLPRQHIIQRIHKTKYSRSIHPLRIYPRHTHKSIISPINQRISIKQKQSFHNSDI